MKSGRILVVSVGVIGAFLFLFQIGFGFSTFDYDLKCTNCLRDYHVAEYKFLGLTYHKEEHLNFEGYDLTPIFGSPCQHIYRKGGFGRQTGGIMVDGETAEGNMFRCRWGILDSAFTLYKRFPNKELMRNTFQFADSILPADATIEYMKNPKYSDVGLLAVLSDKLESAKSEQDWKDALEKVKAARIAESN